MKHLLYIIIAALLLSCADEGHEPLPAVLPIVVEGWIEDGANPMVIVTRAIDLTADSLDLSESVEKWCRVTVSDSKGHSEILTARNNSAYVPSLVFTGRRIKGAVGETYTLLIETDNDAYSATAVIPEPVSIDSLRISRAESSDTLYQIHAFVNIDRSAVGHYKFFTQVRNREKRYYSSFLGTFQSSFYNPATGFSVSRGVHTDFKGFLENPDWEKPNFTPNYCLGDTVSIKLCSIQPEIYDFWRAYENSVSLSGNLLFNISQSCPSNIPGAKGYWAGYGATIRTVVVR